MTKPSTHTEPSTRTGPRNTAACGGAVGIWHRRLYFAGSGSTSTGIPSADLAVHNGNADSRQQRALIIVWLVWAHRERSKAVPNMHLRCLEMCQVKLFRSQSTKLSVAGRHRHCLQISAKTRAVNPKVRAGHRDPHRTSHAPGGAGQRKNGATGYLSCDLAGGARGVAHNEHAGDKTAVSPQKVTAPKKTKFEGATRQAFFHTPTGP